MPQMISSYWDRRNCSDETGRIEFYELDGVIVLSRPASAASIGLQAIRPHASQNQKFLCGDSVANVQGAYGRAARLYIKLFWTMAPLGFQ